MTFNNGIKVRAKARFEGLLHQPNITLCAGLIFVFAIVCLLFEYVYPTNRIFALCSVVVLVCVVLAFLGSYLWRSDSTESLSIASNGAITVKSPSKQLIPALINLLTTKTNRPDKLIPPGMDLKNDPSNFQTITESQGKEIVKKEVEDAVLKHPLIQSGSFNGPIKTTE